MKRERERSLQSRWGGPRLSFKSRPATSLFPFIGPTSHIVSPRLRILCIPRPFFRPLLAVVTKGVARFNPSGRRSLGWSDPRLVASPGSHLRPAVHRPGCSADDVVPDAGVGQQPRRRGAPARFCMGGRGGESARWVGLGRRGRE